VIAVGLVAMLFTYPYQTLTAITLIYLACIPASWRNFRDKVVESSAPTPAPTRTADEPDAPPSPERPTETPPSTTGRIFTLRPSDNQK
jgi:CDP-diacylglycerol--serine O-phosphatidyltransferase